MSLDWKGSTEDLFIWLEWNLAYRSLIPYYLTYLPYLTTLTTLPVPEKLTFVFWICVATTPTYEYCITNVQMIRFDVKYYSSSISLSSKFSKHLSNFIVNIFLGQQLCIIIPSVVVICKPNFGWVLHFYIGPTSVYFIVIHYHTTD